MKLIINQNEAIDDDMDKLINCLTIDQRSEKTLSTTCSLLVPVEVC